MLNQPFLRASMMSPIMKANTPIPPNIPPTIGPVGVEDFSAGGGVNIVVCGVGEDIKLVLGGGVFEDGGLNVGVLVTVLVGCSEKGVISVIDTV